MQNLRNKPFLWLITLYWLMPPLTAQNLENLGATINSKFSEYAPIISPDGKTLYFVREGHPENKGVQKAQNIWVSEKQANGTWGKAFHLDSKLNTEQNSALLGVSPDGNTALVFGYFSNGVRTKTGFSIAKQTKTGWGTPEGMRIEGFETMNRGAYSSATLASDGKTLVLAFMEKTENSFDLFVSFLQTNGNWSRPKNLGKQINTAQGEATPFLASDNKTLYFASQRQGGLGGFDVYVTRRLDSTWQQWSTPTNLGAPINTPENDIYFSLPASGDLAYVASVNEGTENYDIFRTIITEKLRPEPVLLVYGKVYNAKTKEEIAATIVYESLATAQEVGVASASPADGSYKITLPKGEVYGIVGKAEGYFSISEQLDLSNIKEYGEVQKDLYLMPIEVGQTFRLNNIFFDYAQATLRPESFSELNRLIDFLKANPSTQIELQGHTDATGNAQSNQLLSENRAAACRDYLIKKGINNDQVISKGFGKTQPIASNDTEEGRQLNRRVDFKIIK